MEQNIEDLKYPIGRFEKPEQFTEALKRDWLTVLQILPSWMDACIENLDEAQLHVPYRDGGWTIQQVIHHLADSHMNAYIRIKLALTEDKPTIKTYDEQAWALLADNTQPVNISITLLHALHRRLVTLLHTLGDDDWNRTFYHPDRKRDVTVWETAGLYAWHSRHHTAHINGLKERMQW